MSDVNHTLNTSQTRYDSIDILRGVAILGIIVMNIQSFSMIESAYSNPTSYGDLSGINYMTWATCHVIADSKFMTIFSLLFGASSLIFISRIEERYENPTKLHYIRNFWLIIFGLLHAYVLWHGDILFSYGFCAFILYLFRKNKPLTNFILGLLSFSIPALLMILAQWSILYWEIDLTAFKESWIPTITQIEAELSIFRGSWSEQMKKRAEMAFSMQTSIFIFVTFWKILGLMLIGMSLYKWKVLTGELSNSFYTKCVAIGFIIGLPIIVYGLFQKFHHNWSIEYSFFSGSLYNYWATPLVSLSYIGLIMLAYKNKYFPRIFEILSKLGRTALSNYILQTLICSILFYGHGFGLFGKVNRISQLLIIIAIWCVQILLTNFWLKRYKQGPLEWLWRSLTYPKS